jgi:hypothetical protein
MRRSFSELRFLPGRGAHGSLRSRVGDTWEGRQAGCMGTSARFMFMAVTPNGRLQALPERLRLPSRLGPCQRFIVACVRSSRSGCSTTKRSGASSGFGGRPRQARPSIRPHFRGARKRLIPVVDLNDGRRQNRGEQSRQKEEDHRHRQNRRQRGGFFLSHGHS